MSVLDDLDAAVGKVAGLPVAARDGVQGLIGHPTTNPADWDAR